MLWVTCIQLKPGEQLAKKMGLHEEGLLQQHQQIAAKELAAVQEQACD